MKASQKNFHCWSFIQCRVISLDRLYFRLSTATAKGPFISVVNKATVRSATPLRSQPRISLCRALPAWPRSVGEATVALTQPMERGCSSIAQLFHQHQRYLKCWLASVHRANQLHIVSLLGVTLMACLFFSFSPRKLLMLRRWIMEISVAKDSGRPLELTLPLSVVRDTVLNI